MAINPDIVGKVLAPAAFTYTEDQAILYALGIGAGTEELDFLYEKNLKVFPTFAVVPFMPVLMDVFVPQSKLNLFKVLHGEHGIVLHKPIPPSGTVYTTTFCESVYDKGDKGAVVNVRFETRNGDGELLFENRAVIVDRGAGNFGGPRGPKTSPVNPPEGIEPDFRVIATVPENQCALYRLSGDRNPLHIDPAFAKKGGFDRPILHGLCTFGYAGRAVLSSACKGEPNRLKSLSVRFMNVAYPGDTLITEGWKTGDNRHIVHTLNQDGKKILGNGIVTTG